MWTEHRFLRIFWIVRSGDASLDVQISYPTRKVVTDTPPPGYVSREIDLGSNSLAADTTPAVMENVFHNLYGRWNEIYDLAATTWAAVLEPPAAIWTRIRCVVDSSSRSFPLTSKMARARLAFLWIA